jgi:predicted Zn finger-like uncharacterized protein
MNIACTSCSARYGVADEKLIGKRVRITCKRCGTVLIVDGNYNPPTVNASTSMAPSPRVPSRPAPEPKVQPPAPEPPFMVAFADGHQEEADVAQIVRFHRAGRLGNDSVVWRDGMPDWVDPWDVPEIAAAFRRMGYARPTPAPAPPPARQPLREEFDDEATQIHQSGPHHAAPLYEDGEDTHVVDSSSMGSPRPQRDPRVASSPVAADDEVPTHVGTPRGVATRAAAREQQRTRRVSSQPPGGAETAAEEYQRARREAKSRGTPRRSSAPAAAPRQEPVDLFARQAHAGSEEDQEQQPSLGPGHELDIPRLTGARNESSVLFSLDSLLKQEQKSVRPARPPRRDESLLVDQSPSLPTGGGIAPALAAPDFNAPITSPPPRFAPAESPVVEEERTRSSRAWLYLLVLVAFGGAGALGWKTGALRPILIKLGVSAPAPPASASAATPAAAASERTAPPAESSSAAPETAASASAGAPASSASATPSAATATKPPAGVTPRPAGESAARPPSTGTAVSAKEPAAASEKPGAAEKPTAGEKPAAADKPSAAGGTEPFDAAAAKEALSGATANVASCKEMGGPTGNGRVSITFAPSGRPTSVAVTGDLAGTTVGSCIARLYRGVRVPAFSGDAVTVAKGFAVQ